MDRSKDLPTTSRRQVVGGTNNEPASRAKKREEKVTKGGDRTIMGPRGPQTVHVNPGDVIVTVTRQDGTVILNVDRRKSVSSNTSEKNLSRSKTYTPQNLKSTSTLSNLTSSQTLEPQQEALLEDNMTPYEHWYRLNFIKSYIKAYKGEGKDTDPPLSWYNEQLRNLKDPEGIWKEIWRGIDPNHTQELSDAQHEMFYTLNGMGNTNWYNMFNGNLLLATADDLSIPRSSLDYVSPEMRNKSILLTSPSSNLSSVDLSLDDIDKLITLNPDLFKEQYNYAKQNNGAFDYSPSAFDAARLNVNYKYGGIGDFMTAYGLNPKGLYDRLERIYGQ